MLKPTTFVVGVLLGICAEIVLLYFLPGLLRAVSTYDLNMLRSAGFPVSLGSDRFLGLQLSPLAFTMPTHQFKELLVWMFGCALGILLISVGKFVSLPWRYFVNLNLVVITAEATYLFFTGHLGYSTYEFSTLMLRTAVTTWIFLPIFLVVLMSLFPFRLLDQVGFFVFSMVIEIIISALRYAIFVAVLIKTGPILMADLYLLYGPLLDVVPIIGIYCIYLVRLARRLSHSAEAWEWL